MTRYLDSNTKLGICLNSELLNLIRFSSDLPGNLMFYPGDKDSL